MPRARKGSWQIPCASLQLPVGARHPGDCPLRHRRPAPSDGVPDRASLRRMEPGAPATDSSTAALAIDRAGRRASVHGPLALEPRAFRDLMTELRRWLPLAGRRLSTPDRPAAVSSPVDARIP